MQPVTADLSAIAHREKELVKVANHWKNICYKDMYDGIAARILAGSTEQRITTLTDKDRLRKLAYRTLAVEATANGWTPDELHAGTAILREYFDGNRAIIGHVVAGAEKNHPGLPYAVDQVFDEVMGYEPELTSQLNLPGTKWREAEFAV